MSSFSDFPYPNRTTISLPGGTPFLSGECSFEEESSPRFNYVKKENGYFQYGVSLCMNSTTCIVKISLAFFEVCSSPITVRAPATLKFWGEGKNIVHLKIINGSNETEHVFKICETEIFEVKSPTNSTNPFFQIPSETNDVPLWDF